MVESRQLPCSSMVEQLAVNQLVVGSSPTGGAVGINQLVAGSNPAFGAIETNYRNYHFE